jgi:CheY-like chemotaxis protein
VDEGQINQVINNLLINADQAMPEGGTMSIAAENVSLQNGTTFPFREGDYVKISIADQGVGIPKEDIPKIFDPYFTTKQTGNGLGLAMAYSIIKGHSGYLNVESQVGLGTTFSIFIPASKNMKVLRRHEQDKPINGRGRILVMDDEQEIRDITAEMLKSIGYDMEAAKDGMEAIEQYRMASKSEHPFDLVIIDLTVPGGMGGKEAIQKLREIDPDVKAVVSSGYINDPVLTDFDRFGFIDVITKPFNISELSKILYKTIGNGTINRHEAVS